MSIHVHASCLYHKCIYWHWQYYLSLKLINGWCIFCSENREIGSLIRLTTICKISVNSQKCHSTNSCIFYFVASSRKANYQNPDLLQNSFLFLYITIIYTISFGQAIIDKHVFSQNHSNNFCFDMFSLYWSTLNWYRF